MSFPCFSYRRVERGSHPDVTELVPEGARAYLVEQIREVVTAAQYAPTMGRRRIFIFNRADLMNQASANAFLKTLEEPEAGVVFILIAPNETAVLPTILSRCQAVRFRTIPAAEGRGLVARRTGVDPERAAFALAACEGSVTDAVAFAALPASWQLREQVFACLADLHRTDAWGAISAGRGFAANWMAPVEALKAAQEDAKVRESEFLDKQAQKALEDSIDLRVKIAGADRRHVAGIRAHHRPCALLAGRRAGRAGGHAGAGGEHRRDAGYHAGGRGHPRWGNSCCCGSHATGGAQHRL